MEPLLYQVFVTVHIFGAVIGAGAAFVSDITFLKSIKNENIDDIEFSFMDVFSKVVWGGIILILLSGIGLFMLQPETLLASSKFLAKMTIVAIIIINGVLFHVLHIPYIKKNTKKKLFHAVPRGESLVIALSGAISVVSWMSALFLGTLRQVSFSYAQILSLYAVAVACAMIVAYVSLRHMFTKVDSTTGRTVVASGMMLVLGVATVVWYPYVSQQRADHITDPAPIPTTFSIADVASHAVDTDCYVIVDELVFDVSAFTELHPSAFRCGTDVSDNYHKNHGPIIRPQMMQFHIGSLVSSTPEPATTDMTNSVSSTFSPQTTYLAPPGTWDVRDLMIVVERDTESLLIIDSSVHTPVGRIEGIGYQPHTNVFSPDGTYSYLISRDGWLSKTNLQTLEVEAYTRVGINSRGTALTDDGTYIVVGNYEPGTIVVLDAATLTIQAEIPLTVTVDGQRIVSRAGALVEKGTQVFIALKDANSVWVLETADDTIHIANKFDMIGGTDSVLHDGYLTPDGTYFIVAAQDANVVWVLDTETMTEVARVPTGKQPHTGPGATWESTTFVPALGEGLITAIDTTTWEPRGYIPTGGPGLFVRHSPIASYPYIWADTAFGEHEDELYVIDARTLDIVQTLIPMEGKRSIHPEFTRDGAFVYALVWGGDKIYVYDATTFAVVTTIDATSPSLISNVGARLAEPGI